MKRRKSKKNSNNSWNKNFVKYVNHFPLTQYWNHADIGVYVHHVQTRSRLQQTKRDTCVQFAEQKLYV